MVCREILAVVETLRSFAQNQSRSAPVTIQLSFQLDSRRLPRRGATARRCSFVLPTGASAKFPRNSASPASDMRRVACCTANPANGVFANEEGKVERPALRGGMGQARAFGNNSHQSHRSAASGAENRAGNGRRCTGEGATAYCQLLAQRQVCWVDYAAWRRIDAAELAGAGSERCRAKFRSVAEMLDAAQAEPLRSSVSRDR